MLKSFLALFEQSHTHESKKHTVELATAALLSEVMRADSQIEDQERKSVKHQISTLFSLNDDALSILLDEGLDQSERAVDLVQFTSVINDSFDIDQRIDVLESMWKVALADGNLDKYEEHIIRKIADLLYIPHSQYIKTKLVVTE